MVPDDETLRAMLADSTPGPWDMVYTDCYHISITAPYRGCVATVPADEVIIEDGDESDHGEDEAAAADGKLIALAPSLAAEVLRLRARAEKAEAERDALRAAVRDFLDTPAPCYGVALQAVVDALGGDQ